MSDNQPVLSIKDFHVGIEGNEILHGITSISLEEKFMLSWEETAVERQLLQVPSWDIQTMK